MNSLLPKAIIAYAQAAAPFLGTPPTVAGPTWQQAPASAANGFPYAVFIIVGAGQLDWFTNATYVERARIRFSVWHSDNNLALLYAGQIASRFTNASIALSSGQCVGTLPIALPYSVPVPPQTKDASGNPAYHVVTDIRFWLA